MILVKHHYYIYKQRNFLQFAGDFLLQFSEQMPVNILIRNSKRYWKMILFAGEM